MISALVGHLVGDFLLQNDYLATNKKKCSWTCALHCFVWSLSVMTIGEWPTWTLLPLFVTHFIQDRTQIIPWSMRKVGQENFMAPPLGPWSIILVDQVWHILTLWIIWRFCIGT